MFRFDIVFPFFAVYVVAGLKPRSDENPVWVFLGAGNEIWYTVKKGEGKE